MTVFKAPEQAAYVIRAISRDIDGRRKEYLRYLNAKRRVIGARTVLEPDFDPRARPWYALGLGSDRAALTEPFVFYSLQQPGITVTRRVSGGGVLGLAITVSQDGPITAYEGGRRVFSL